MTAAAARFGQELWIRKRKSNGAGDRTLDELVAPRKHEVTRRRVALRLDVLGRQMGLRPRLLEGLARTGPAALCGRRKASKKVRIDALAEDRLNRASRKNYVVWGVFLLWLAVGTAASVNSDSNGKYFADGWTHIYYLSAPLTVFTAAFFLSTKQALLLPIAVFFIVGYPLFECAEDCVGIFVHGILTVLVLYPAALLGLGARIGYESRLRKQRQADA